MMMKLCDKVTDKCDIIITKLVVTSLQTQLLHPSSVSEVKGLVQPVYKYQIYTLSSVTEPFPLFDFYMTNWHVFLTVDMSCEIVCI